jgi:hypothetical protein
MPSEGSRKPLFAVLTLLTLILVAWLALGLRTKSKYDAARQQTQKKYAVISMDQQSIAFLADVENNWICKVDETNGSDSEVVKLAGITRSAVAGITRSASRGTTPQYERGFCIPG